MVWVQFTHTNQAKISEVWISIRIPLRQLMQLFDVLAGIEGNLEHAGRDEFERFLARPQMKCSFRENGFAR